MGKMSSGHLTSLIRAFGEIKGPTLQLNCVDIPTLRDAQNHPENHHDLIVRISGLSARFVSLERTVQDEIITRNMMDD